MAGITDPDYLAWKAQQAINNTTRQNQFADITEYEPFDIARNNFDNPPFVWPAKQYTDITGNQIKIQRGYMRSLITDPRWSSSANSKNRRLFFQFNPSVLVRSVQQTVGSMNPLLQDPAQLIQPVPGTATFGFELLFNREREVASGMSYAPGEQPSFDDMMVLPNGDAAIASQIGVLADILVLDTITGQGISKDMIDLVTARSRARADADITSREQRIKALGEGDDNETDIAIEQAAVDDLRTKLDSLSEQYNLNLGNQAFLNPLPFRVMFSSLFMVEGVATSVEVQYQKFSATMIPTQCKVIINMYALYLGFAAKDTFLTKNLESSFVAEQEANQEKTGLKSLLNLGVKSILYEDILYAPRAGSSERKNTFRLRSGKVVLDESVLEKIKKKEISDFFVNVFINFAYFPSSSSLVTESALTLRGQWGTNTQGVDISYKLGSIFAGTALAGEDWGGLRCYELQDSLSNAYSGTTPYLAYQLEVIVSADGVQSDPFLFPIVKGINLLDLEFGDKIPGQVFSNNKSTRLTPTSGVQ